MAPMLEALADGVWVREDWLRFYGVRVAARMAVLRLAEGRLFVLSPTALVDGLRRAVDALGQVAWIVSPNKIHHQSLGDWARVWPGARLLASPGLVERRPDLRFDATLGDAPEADWAEALDQTATAGNAFFSELVFLHRGSRTLFVADLVETFEARHTSVVGRAVLRALGGLGRARASPEHRWYTDDAEAAAARLARIAAWDFERIVPAHGVVVERDARAVFRAVADDLLEGARRRPRWRRVAFANLARLQ